MILVPYDEYMKTKQVTASAKKIQPTKDDQNTGCEDKNHHEAKQDITYVEKIQPTEDGKRTRIEDKIEHVKEDVKNIDDQKKLSDELIISAIPLYLKKKALALLMFLKKSAITWSNSGELVYEGTPIAYSNICDLIKDSIKQYKNFNPVGLDSFYRLLAEKDIPPHLILNDKRRNTVEYYKMYPKFSTPPTVNNKKIKKSGVEKRPSAEIDWLIFR